MSVNDFDTKILDPHWYTTPEHHAAFKMLRDEDPVHWTEDPVYGKDYWLLTRYDHTLEYLQDPARFSSRLDTRVPRTPKRRTPEERHAQGLDVRLTTNDDPVHALYRRPMNKHFSVPSVGKLRAHIERVVDEIIRDVAPKGEVDVVEDLASALPMKVVLGMLGVPESDMGYLDEATWQWMSAADPRYIIDGDEVATSLHGLQKLIDYGTELAKDRQKNPRDDFATAITQMEIDGDPLSVHEAMLYYVTVIGGGAETTRTAASVGTWLFMQHPEQRRLLLEDPALAKAAAEEVVRWSTPERNRFRVATQDFDFHGKRIRTGDWVITFLTSANRDERVFDRPDAFDIQRTPNDHLSFGAGVHGCLGRNLARLELTVFFPKLLEAFPDLEMTEPGEPNWIADRSVAGFTTMPVSFTPRDLSPSRVA
ncbi:cytochrome P450 [Agrococcus baldri]|uniref:Cytochrome P450 n=1 Tax=Agrococcus baldri TaxID=153730 RepID=A0AA87RES8_9MICO|nr:cytochrome P450 [Agrococcus baldri]GEK79150.1 cytochrome P450 [Agrococcus baldri]